MHATTDYAVLAKADVVLIDVETPVRDDTHQPEYAALRAVCRSLGPVLKSGALIIIESTIAPGTVDNVVRPLLERHSGKVATTDFWLGTCPERVMPGKLLTNLRTMSRVCGGDTPATAHVMGQLYQYIVEADLDPADIITAELVKTAENAYRDVQIAFANEVALICEVNGADVWQVRELVNKSPYRQMHMPGAGVGGHCIPKDPWLLASAASEDVPVRLIPAARAINNSMPRHVADLTLATLAEAGQSTKGVRVLVLGYAYLADSDDTRNSPSVVLVEHLRECGAVPVIHDPWVAEYRGDVLERAAGCAAAIVMVTHRAYHTLDLDALQAALTAPVLIDGRGMFEPHALRARGWYYRGVGR
jgi:UDP-N-acetyl-D-mannosaminuronic acid dehydrogenase